MGFVVIAKKLAMFGHLLQVSCLSFGSTFKQFTLVSGYT